MRKNEETRTIDQKSLAKVVAARMGREPEEILAIIEEEQRMTMSYVRRGYRVEKRGYLTLEPKIFPAYTFISGLDGKPRHVETRKRLSIRLGQHFKDYLKHEWKSENPLQSPRDIEKPPTG